MARYDQYVYLCIEDSGEQCIFLYKKLTRDTELSDCRVHSIVFQPVPSDTATDFILQSFVQLRKFHRINWVCLTLSYPIPGRGLSYPAPGG